MNGELLIHYGVPGMKWGVRRQRNASNSTGKQSKSKEKVADKLKKKITKEKAIKAVAKGAKMTAKLAKASLADDIILGGAGKRAIKQTIKQTGRAAVTAYTMANGGYDIRWYDN